MFTAVINESVNGTTINNIAPLGRQTVTSKGTAQRTFVKSHRFKADDRRYESAPYASQTNTFPDAPNSVIKLLSDPSVTAAIQKGLNKYLGGSK
ncbi:hypothetical protein [Herbaspirillum rubrisubalbicans]|uniref:hypothetical protein n=1 Tax=Herbaspirillum rubrisubalbicans TaxID=80842 RepID=UPI0011BEA9B7|nr:hypothetical protein [Herbaspirillum rubrisubalbicans]